MAMTDDEIIAANKPIEISPEEQLRLKMADNSGPVQVTSTGEAGVPLPPQVWPVPPGDPLARPPRPATRMSAGKRATR